MVTILDTQQKKLFDGSDALLYKQRLGFDAGGNHIEVQATKLCRLNDIDAEASPGDVSFISNCLAFGTRSFSGKVIYQGSEHGLQLYYQRVMPKGGMYCFAIFSFGETQPGRTKLVYEALFRMGE